MQVAETPSPNVFFLFANHNPKVSTTTSNPHIQNAIRYGIDYTGLVALAGSGAVQAAGIIPSMFLGALPAGRRAQARPDQGQGRGRGLGHQQPDGEPRVPERHQLERPSASACSRRGSQSDLGKVGITVEADGQPGRDRARHATAPAPSSSGCGTGARTTRTRTTTSRSCRARLVGLRAGWPAGADPTLEALGTKAAAMSTPPSAAAAVPQIQTAAERDRARSSR